MALSNANITSDLIDGSTFQIRYNPLGVVEAIQYDRVCMVTGLNANTTTANAVIAALQAVQAKYPVCGPDANVPLATARGYATRPVTSDDALEVVVSFAYAQVPWNPLAWNIESDSYGELQDTDIQYDSGGNAIPIKVDNYILGWTSFQTSSGSYQAPPTQPGSGSGTETPQPVEYGPVSVLKPLKRWQYSRQITSESAAVAFDKASLNYCQRLNSVTFTGLTSGAAAQNLSCAPETVLCESVSVSFDPYENQTIARVTLLYRPEGWQPYIKYRDPLTGEIPANVWRGGMVGTTAFAANGVVRTTAYQTADLNALLSSLTGSPALPFGGGT